MSEVSRRDSDPKESTESKVVLYFFRHGKKEAQKEGQKEEDVLLTEKGRKQAVEKGQQLTPHPEVSVAFGSERVRSQETATRIMLSGLENINSDTPLEEIQLMIDKELEYGKKTGKDSRLGFVEEEGSEILATSDAWHEKQKRLRYLVDLSDSLVVKNKDLKSTCYTRHAANIASLVKKYLIIGNNFNRITNADPSKYEAFNNTLERYIGTHNGIGESFILKIVEKQQGAAAREELLQAIGEGGFGDTEGFTLEIVDQGQIQQLAIKLHTKEKDWSISVGSKILDDIIEERKQFDKQIE